MSAARRSLHRIGGARAGNVTIEFAILLPVFLTILFGLLDASLYFWSRSALRHGVTQSARCAAIGREGCVLSQDVQAYAVRQSYGLRLTNEAFAVTDQTCGKQVIGRYDYKSSFGSFSPFNSIIKVRSCF